MNIYLSHNLVIESYINMILFYLLLFIYFFLVYNNLSK